MVKIPRWHSPKSAVHKVSKKHTGKHAGHKAAHKGVHHGGGRKGLPLSEEHKKKISLGMKRYHASHRKAGGKHSVKHAGKHVAHKHVARKHTVRKAAHHRRK